MVLRAFRVLLRHFLLTMLLAAPLFSCGAQGASKNIPKAVPPKVVSKMSSTLPAPIAAALKQANIPKSDFSLAIFPLEGSAGSQRIRPSGVEFNAHVPRIPASVEKVVTAAAALEAFGPAKVWATRVVSPELPDSDGVLKADLYFVGSGDPVLSVERFWLLLNQLRSRGVRRIEGNIALDRSLFDVEEIDPFAFDGEGHRPYNQGPDALLINSRSLFIHFRPDPAKGVAYIYPEPMISSISLPGSIPLSKEACGAWRKQIDPDFSNPLKPRFKGKFPASCGAKDFFYTSMTADSYFETLFKEIWSELGGSWSGKIVRTEADEDLKPFHTLAETYSPPLSAIVTSMNKYSNNLIARQLFLLLDSTRKAKPLSLEGSRSALSEWAIKAQIPPNELKAENGSGLSRTSRISAAALAAVLQKMWASPQMPEFMASLPVSGVDGTMKKRHVAQGRAHIKTGYLSDSRSIAGYVLGKSGTRYAVAAIVNGASASGALPVMDKIIDWVSGE